MAVPLRVAAGRFVFVVGVFEGFLFEGFVVVAGAFFLVVAGAFFFVVVGTLVIHLIDFAPQILGCV